MQRRHLLGAFSPIPFRGSNRKTFQAIGAARMPASLESDCHEEIMEVRRYEGAAAAGPALARLLESHGFRIVNRDGLNVELAFGSTEERQVLWSRVTADVNWHILRESKKLAPLEITVYRML